MMLGPIGPRFGKLVKEPAKLQAVLNEAQCRAVEEGLAPLRDTPLQQLEQKFVMDLVVTARQKSGVPTLVVAFANAKDWRKKPLEEYTREVPASEVTNRTIPELFMEMVRSFSQSAFDIERLTRRNMGY